VLAHLLAWDRFRRNIRLTLIEERQVSIRLTRSQAAEWLNAHGYPIKHTYFELLCSPKVGQGPRIAGRFGQRVLYRPEDLAAWAEARFKPEAA
jgi:hypothetical protein